MDIHPLVKNKEMFLGGINIPYHKGFEGHSDGDILLHAICDSMLGALGLRDIGNYFPNTDNQYKDISSITLLSKTNEIVKKNNYNIEQIDTFICLEEPKINQYIDRMQEVIANTLKIKSQQISIKSSTAEGLGFVGKKMGAQANAVILLRKALAIPILNQTPYPIPQYATTGSSGVDLHANIIKPIKIAPMKRTLIPSGVFLELPKGIEAQIRPRSGLALDCGVTCLNTPGTIDSDYRGEIKILLINLDSEKTTEIKPGQKIAQMVLQQIEQAHFYPIKHINNKTQRHDKGFGHSGI